MRRPQQIKREQRKEKGKEKEKEKEENIKIEEDIVVGIDLGTTYSCISYWCTKQNIAKVIPNTQKKSTTPSYVGFEKKKGKKNYKLLIGDEAKEYSRINPKNVVYDIKRVIGQSSTDPIVEEEKEKYAYTLKIIDDKIMVELETGENRIEYFTPEQISGFIQSYLRDTAEKYLKVPIKRAVITVPAYFNDAQRQATKNAGAIAKLDVLRIINEPTSTSLAYGLDKQSLNNPNNNNRENVQVFDLGGGTFDVSIININNDIFEVKATGGDTHLGGEDIDYIQYEYLLKIFTNNDLYKKALNDDINIEKKLKNIQRQKIERSKREQTTIPSVVIFIPLCKDINLNYTLTRDEFNNIVKPIYTRCIDRVESVLRDANMKVKDIDDIVLVGGSTRIPRIQELQSKMFCNKILCKSLNPDEAVSLGASVQGAILTNKRNNMDSFLLKDVIPLSLGIEVVGNKMSIILPRNTTIPCLRREIYTTEYDYQQCVKISIYEGESLHIDENHLLDEFTISNIERAEKGIPQIAVEFSVDSNGILTVSANDCNTNSYKEVKIRRNKRDCTNNDIEKLSITTERYMSSNIDENDIDNNDNDKLKELIENCLRNVIKQVRQSNDNNDDDSIITKELNTLFGQLRTVSSI